MNIRLTERGGEVPVGAGVTDDNGFPLVTGEGLAANAWALWRAVRNRADREGAPAKAQYSVLGSVYFCKLHEIEKLIWPVLVTAEGDPSYPFSKYCRDEIRQYLAETENMMLMPGTGGGRVGASWWVRGKWNGVQPVVFNDGMAVPPPVPLRLTPAEAEQVEEALAPEPEPVVTEAPAKYELGGDSLLADILQCMDGEDRMHAVDLCALLAAGNPRAYAGLTVTTLGTTLKQLGTEYDRVTLNMKTLAGVRTVAIQAALDAQRDAEAAAILEEAHAKAEALAPPPAIGKALRFVEALDHLGDAGTAILGEMEALRRRVEEQDAELEKYRKQPVQPPDQALIDKAVAKMQTDKDKLIAEQARQIEELTYQVKALRRLRS